MLLCLLLHLTYYTGVYTRSVLNNITDPNPGKHISTSRIDSKIAKLISSDVLGWADRHPENSSHRKTMVSLCAVT